jgi:hypothetical protein
LVLLDALLSEKLGLRISDCGTLAPKYYIYIDDILATGGSYLKYISPFLNSNNNVDKLSKNQFKLISLFFCTHTWGEFNARYILKMKNSKDGFMNNKLFPIYSSFELENNIKNHNQKLNIAYLSTALKTKETDEYIFNLSLADRNYARAYRPLNNPNIELFFSNAVNRIRFESILFHKGLELLSQSAELKHNHRPLGMTNPTNQTFGTGTLFFTWTNISNTCPLVFWWEGHNWQGLFPLKNRGL